MLQYFDMHLDPAICHFDMGLKTGVSAAATGICMPVSASYPARSRVESRLLWLPQKK